MDSRPPPPQGLFPYEIIARTSIHHDPYPLNTGPPPPYAFVARVYKKSLRPVILAIAFPVLLWTLFAAIGYFRNASLENLDSVPKLRAVYIVMGALYMSVAGIELLGLVAAGTQRIPLIRLYAYASALVVLIIAGTGLLEIVIHFTSKNDIINICTENAANGRIVYFGFWGPFVRDLDFDEAKGLCQNYWDRDSWQDIVVFLVTTLIAAFFSSCAFAYLRQVLDPSSAANAARAPSFGARNGDYPSHYHPAYNAGGYGQYYGQQPAPAYGYGNDAFVPPYEAKPGYTAPEGKAGYGEDSKNPFDDSNGSSSRV